MWNNPAKSGHSATRDDKQVSGVAVSCLAMNTVALFIPCFVDQLVPQVAFDMAAVLRRIGYRVELFPEQTCCGQPAFNAGYWNEARPLAQRFVEIFRTAEFVVCPSGSCTTMLRVFYPELLAKAALRRESIELGKRVFEFSEFLVGRSHTSEIAATFPHKVAYHDACHALRELHLKQEPRKLLEKVHGLQLVEMAYSEDCCGFGGTFATKFDMISVAMGNSKAASAEASAAEFVTSTDPSCLMQIEGILRRRKSAVRTIHLASILAQTADGQERDPQEANRNPGS